MASPATMADRLESLDAATGEVIAHFEVTSPANVNAAVERARTAQTEWSRLDVDRRAQAIARLHEVLYRRRGEIAEVVTRETGKPRVESFYADVLVALDTAAYYSNPRRLKRLLRPRRVPHHNLALKTKRGWLCYEPYGVIGIISPWNYPVAIPLGQMIPALAVGNAVVLKPSEFTPWCGALVGEVLHNAGFPAGLVEVVQGGGAVGAALVDSPAVAKVIFTGSVATGKCVAEACARRLLPSVLELGGKDAMIVLADADLEVAASGAVWGGFTNCGQACLSVERIYVEQAVADRFTDFVVAGAQKLRVGPGSEPESDVGPMIRPQQLERVDRQLRDAVARGARVRAGGKRATRGGNFFEPTVVTNVDHSMELMREETFGPVLAICPVRDVDEAVRLANDSPFGLAASVWTRDTRRGRQIAAQLHAGTVMVNDALSSFGICEAPHGGRGASGWGRTHSRLGLLEMVQVKYLDVDGLPRMAKPWWFPYGSGALDAAERFVEFLAAPRWKERLRSTREVMRAALRRKRL